MDALIRAADVSAQPRQLRRPGVAEVHPVAPATAVEGQAQAQLPQSQSSTQPRMPLQPPVPAQTKTLAESAAPAQPPSQRPPQASSLAPALAAGLLAADDGASRPSPVVARAPVAAEAPAAVAPVLPATQAATVIQAVTAAGAHAAATALGELLSPQDQQAQAALAVRETALARREDEVTALRARLEKQEAELAAARRELDEQAAQRLADAEQRGLAQGQACAAQEAQEAAAQRLAALDAAVAAFDAARSAGAPEQEDLLVETIHGVLCRMLGDSAASPDSVLAQVRRLVGAAHDSAQLRLRLHPQDAELLRGMLAAGAHQLDPRVSIQGDADVGLGGGLLDSERGTLDARLDIQLQQLRQTLLAVRQRRAQPEVAD
ncbi:FliH/SctL family protein [Massilia sp. erpn]|uniref:FliH/SctL family protein n=1 Tax=Massilia sp. erpn TaxID=2738142 RepID=UPI0021025C1B|nr:FliH/SctL family protein [Massilia sp. erpn]UTY59305.1 hypothetical protein HPQ68_20275 [Massilia sp. erpn]